MSPSLSPQDVARRRKSLEDRRAYLIGQIDTMTADLQATPEQDWEDRAVDLADDEVQETLTGTDSEELRAIAAALGRIETGRFGICVRCGEAIESERLDLLPHTPFCADCARAKG